MTPNHSHYSVEFIQEMQARLEDERQKIKSELNQDAHQEHSDYVANFPEYGRTDEENVSEIADYTTLNATTEALESRLDDVNSALNRISNGTYGVTDSGDIIPEERLRANPAANTLVQ